MDITLLRGPLALSEDATEAQALVAIQALTEKAGKADVLADELRAMTEQRDSKTAEFAALTERADKLTVVQAIHDGRIGQAQGERYLRVLSALGEDEAHAIFPANAIATAPAIKPDGKPAEDADAAPATADEQFEATFAAALKEGKSQGEAYSIADEATREARNNHYLAIKAEA